jgi:diguanylate cyclase (GGDEF)-like protein
MAGSLRKLDSGQVLFDKGDPSDSMYAIISGELDVIDPLNDGELTDTKDDSIYKLIQRLAVGDVVGEMGLLRTTPRSATVIASKPAELLEINLKMIKRLQWLYPPTAQKFFFNLMSILCDRLENATHSLAATCSIDDLTHLCNRRSFLDCLGNELYRSRRFKHGLGLCLMEVGFVTDNPQNAFELRDRVLTHVSEILNAQTRQSDIPGRLGLHTFGLLLPNTSIEKAETICDRLLGLLDVERFSTAKVKVVLSLDMIDLSSNKDETDMARLVTQAAERLHQQTR